MIDHKPGFATLCGYNPKAAEAEANRAHDEWGCNCGPTALAYASNRTLDAVRAAMPEFDSKRYTNPTMMAAGIRALGFTHRALPLGKQRIFPAGPTDRCVMRVQWEGPWTAPGANPRWAYTHTHWVATVGVLGFPCIFDCNGGENLFERWEKLVVPLLMPKRGTGWKPTHIWRLKETEKRTMGRNCHD